MINLIENQSLNFLMKDATRNILVSIGGFAGWALFDRWQKLYTSILESVHENFPDAILISLVIMAGAVALYDYKFSKKNKPEPKPQKIILESRFEQRADLEQYVNHLKKDIFEVLESKKQSSYFDAMCLERENEKMILQHMYTYEGVNKQPQSYSRYRNAWHIFNLNDNYHFKITDVFGQFMIESSKIIKNRDFSFKGRIFEDKWLEVLGLPTQHEVYKKDFDINKIKTLTEFEISKTYFYYQQDYRNKSKHYLKYDENIIAESNSKRTIMKLQKPILECSLKIIKLINKSQYKQRERIVDIEIFNEVFTHFNKSLQHGKPNFGVCDGCVNIFPLRKKSTYEYYLDLFNADPRNILKQFW